MINAKNVKALYADIKFIKPPREKPDTPVKVYKPSDLTVAVIIRLLIRYVELSKSSLLKKTNFSKYKLDIALKHLVSENKLKERAVSKSGDSFIFSYSLVRGNLWDA